jgi:hypothetical protein
MGNVVKPAADRLPPPDRARIARQGQKRSLKGVFRVVFMPEHVPAHAPNKPAVPLKQSAEGPFLSLRDEPLEQLGIAQLLDPSRIDEVSNVVKN